MSTRAGPCGFRCSRRFSWRVPLRAGHAAEAAKASDAISIGAELAGERQLVRYRERLALPVDIRQEFFERVGEGFAAGGEELGGDAVGVHAGQRAA